MRVPAPKLGAQDYQSAVSESSDDAMFLHFFVSSQLMGAQWLSGRVLEPRLRDRGFEPHRPHCVISLSKNINPSLVLVQLRKTCPYITENIIDGTKQSSQLILLNLKFSIVIKAFLLSNLKQLLTWDRTLYI